MLACKHAFLFVSDDALASLCLQHQNHFGTGTAANVHHRRYRRPALSGSGHLKSREAAVYPNSSYNEQDLGAKAQIFAIQPFGRVAH